MAKWEELDPEQQKAVAQVMMKGQKPTPENMNRVNQALAANPSLLARAMQEAGLDGAAESVDEAETSGQDIQSRLLAGDEEDQMVGEANADAVSDTGEEDMPQSVDELDPDEQSMIMEYRRQRKKRAPQMPGRAQQAMADTDNDGE